MASFAPAPTSAGETKEGDEVATFLRSHNLEEYHAKFIDEGYDSLSRLKNLELVDLVEDIGMKKGHARQILREIASLVILQQYPSEPVQPPKREASKINMMTDANHPPTEFNHNQWCTVRDQLHQLGLRFRSNSNNKRSALYGLALNMNLMQENYGHQMSKVLLQGGQLFWENASSVNIFNQKQETR